MPGARGSYSPINQSLPDDPEFQQLTAPARLTFYTLRVCAACNVACIFRFYRGTLAEQAGLKPAEIDDALEELSAAGWISIEGTVVWIRNGLRYHSSFRWNVPNHRTSLMHALSGLPKTATLLGSFLDYYASEFGAHPDLVAGAEALRADRTCTASAPGPLQQPAAPKKERVQKAKNQPDGIPFADILEMFNRVTGKGITGFTPRNVNAIKARWAEGHRLPEFEKVCATMTKACGDGTWGSDGKDMRPFLHPDTLFSDKFGKYLSWNAGRQPAAAGRRLPTMAEMLAEKGVS